MYSWEHFKGFTVTTDKVPANVRGANSAAKVFHGNLTYVEQ